MERASIVRRRCFFRVEAAYLIIAWFFLQVGGALAPAHAAECSSPSPGKLSGKDLYELGGVPTPLTPKEIQSFKKVLKAMEGRWRGEDKGFLCEDNVGKGRKRPPVLTIESQGRFENPNSFVLDSNISSAKAIHRDLLRLELKDNRLWVNRGDVGLISLSDRNLAFGYKLRQGGTITELYWYIKTGPRTLTIEQVNYGNGLLSSSSTWTLKQPY